MNFLPSPFNLSIRPTLGVGGEEILDDGAAKWEYSLPRGGSKGFEEGQGAATRDQPLRGRLVSLRSADAFPVVASLPPKNSVCKPERQNDFRDVKHF